MQGWSRSTAHLLSSPASFLISSQALCSETGCRAHTHAHTQIWQRASGAQVFKGAQNNMALNCFNSTLSQVSQPGGLFKVFPSICLPVTPSCSPAAKLAKHTCSSNPLAQMLIYQTFYDNWLQGQRSAIEEEATICVRNLAVKSSWLFHVYCSCLYIRMHPCASLLSLKKYSNKTEHFALGKKKRHAALTQSKCIKHKLLCCFRNLIWGTYRHTNMTYIWMDWWSNEEQKWNKSNMNPSESFMKIILPIIH